MIRCQETNGNMRAVHKFPQAGNGNFTGVGRDGRAVSAGCQVVCTSQFGDFERATGMIPSAGPPQQHFTVGVWTDENFTHTGIYPFVTPEQ